MKSHLFFKGLHWNFLSNLTVHKWHSIHQFHHHSRTSNTSQSVASTSLKPRTLKQVAAEKGNCLSTKRIPFVLTFIMNLRNNRTNGKCCKFNELN